MNNYLKLISSRFQSFKTIQSKYNLFNYKINTFSSEAKLKTVEDIKRAALKNLDPDHSRIKKEVLLYQNENTGFYKKLGILNVCQFFFWVYIANFGLIFYFEKPKKLSAEEKSQLKEQKQSYWHQIKHLAEKNWIHVSLAAMCITVAHISMALITLFTIRSVRYVVLHPGGQKVRITCFSALGAENRYRNHDIPLENISASQHRNSAVNYIPIKVKGKWFYFLIDKKGHFIQTTLYDETVGVFRILR